MTDLVELFRELFPDYANGNERTIRLVIKRIILGNHNDETTVRKFLLSIQ